MEKKKGKEKHKQVLNTLFNSIGHTFKNGFLTNPFEKRLPRCLVLILASSSSQLVLVCNAL